MRGTWLFGSVASDEVSAPPAGGRFGAGARRLRALLSPWGAPLVPRALNRSQRRLPFVAGALAAGAALNVTVLMRLMGVGIFVPEASVEWVVDNIPGVLESGAIGLMGGYAKVF